MATAEELCAAKARACGASKCAFGKPNALNPSVVFTGCPACSKEAAAGVTAEQAEADMAAFMERIKR